MNKSYLLLVLLLLCRPAISQHTDTASLIKEFKKVMGFATQPYLYYSAITKITSAPVLEALDTLTLQAVFYKNQDELYYGNEREITYLQDSLLIQVNHERKTIWVSRVAMDTKEKLNTLPFSNKQLQEMLQKNYTIWQDPVNNQVATLHFETKQTAGHSAVISTSTALNYSEKNYYPQSMAITMRMQQPASDELIAQIKNQGADEQKLIQVIEGKKYLVRMQKINMALLNMENTKEKAAQMPRWQEVIGYNAAEQSYTGRGQYAEYTVTKTF